MMVSEKNNKAEKCHLNQSQKNQSRIADVLLFMSAKTLNTKLLTMGGHWMSDKTSNI